MRWWVSAPAVSKWETGQSYPDITLLPPLARYFGVPVDTLLAYSPQLSDSERESLVEAADEVFADKGFQAGMDYLAGLAREYPDDKALRLFFSMPS